MIESIDPDDDAVCVKKARELLQNEQLPLDLIAVTSCFGFLGSSIKELENSNLSLKETFTILDTVVSKINSARGPRAMTVQEKLRRVFLNNEGLTFMRRACEILEGSCAPENSRIVTEKLKNKEILSLKFAQLTSCDVERSFSIYKNILTDRRTNFTMDNLEMYIVSNYYVNRRDGTLNTED